MVGTSNESVPEMTIDHTCGLQLWHVMYATYEVESQCRTAPGMVELFDQWIVKAKIEEVSNIGVFLQIIPVSQILEWMVDGQCGKSQVHRDCRCKDRTRILEMIVIRGIFSQPMVYHHLPIISDSQFSNCHHKSI